MAKKKTSSSPKGCTTSNDCDTKNTCIKGICTPDQGYTPDPVNYGDGKSCILKGTGDCSRIPKGITPYCYPNDDEHPNEIQFCAYEKSGFLTAAEGCCSKTCPSEECTVKQAPPAQPEKDRPKGVPYKKKDKKPKESEPFPKLLKILLIIFAILLIAAGIFLSVSN